MSRLDFTVWTEGRHTTHGQIATCPKCGRKGARQDYPWSDVHAAFREFIHTGRESDKRFHPLDKCIVSAYEPEWESTR